jgi:hypothetical protein
MARTTLEYATIPARELDALRRDRSILEMVESDYRARRPEGPTLRQLFGGLLDSKRTIDGILAAHLRRLDDRAAADRPSAPAPGRNRAG